MENDNNEGEVSFESFFDAFEEPTQETAPEKAESKKELVEEEKSEEPKEQEEAQPKEVETTPPKEKEEVKPTPKSNGVHDRVKSLIELGFLEDTGIEIDDEQDPRALSEFDDITEDQLKEIIQLQKGKKDQDRDTNYIKKDGLSEHQLKIIEFVKDGGNLKDVFEKPETATKRPYEGVDVQDPKIQKAIALRDYIHKGLDQDEAVKLVLAKEKDFKLDSFVEDIVNRDTKQYDDYLEKITSDQKKKSQEDQDKVKNTRKTLSQTFKDNGIKEAVSKRVIDSVISQNPNEKAVLEDIFDEIRSNPEKNYLKLLHLIDEKSFNELAKQNTTKHTTEKVLKLSDAYKVNAPSRKTQDKQTEKEVSDFEEFFQN